MEHFINLSAQNEFQLQHGNQNQSLIRLFQVTADRVRRGRITCLISAFSPSLAAKKVDNMIAIDTSSAFIVEMHRSAEKKPLHFHETPEQLAMMPRDTYNRRIFSTFFPPVCPPIVATLKDAWLAGFNDRLAYTGRQKAETRAKKAQEADFFLMGWNSAQRRINASKPKKATKRKSKVA